MGNVIEMRRQRAELLDKAQGIVDAAVTEGRALSAEEQAEVRGFTDQADGIEATLKTVDAIGERRAVAPEAPMINLKTKLGDSEERAIAYYVRTGKDGALNELRASNDTDLNIGTPADGGYAVPTGHFQGIIAKRDTIMLADKLGVLRVPGRGAVTNVPVDNGSANQFVATNEVAAFDRDAPVLGQAAMTLVWYTKKVQLSYQLMAGEDSQLMAFLNDWVGRAYGITHNALLVTEALASGTSVTLGTAAAANASDPATMIYSQKGEYAEGSQWVMKRATDGAYRKLTGSVFQFAPTGGPVDTLWNYPVNWSESVPAIGAGNKSLIFGNFAYMGLYEAPSMTFLRDPYSAAGTGQVNLYYHFAAVYKVLVAEAVLYGKNPTA